MQVESKSVYRDDDYTVRYQPNENYEFAHLYIDGKEVTDLTNEQKESYTFSNVQESHSIRVEYRWKYLPYVLGGIGVISSGDLDLCLYPFSALVEEKKSFQAERSAEEGFSGPGGKCRTGETGRHTISGRTSGGLRRAGTLSKEPDPGD